MTKIIRPQSLIDSTPPTNEEIHAVIMKKLDLVGIPSGAVEVQEGEWCVYQPSSTGNDKLAPLYMVITQPTGMVIFFPVAGPLGVHAAVHAKREAKAQEGSEFNESEFNDGYKAH